MAVLGAPHQQHHRNVEQEENPHQVKRVRIAQQRRLLLELPVDEPPLSRCRHRIRSLMRHEGRQSRQRLLSDRA